jgi:maleylacetoacetate isomerase
VLYDYWRSSSSYRVRIGLSLLGISWERAAVDLFKGEQKAAAHLARNPQGLVPALEIDGVLLTQSLAILEYLNETRGAGWLPGAPADRARQRALAYAIAMEIQPVCNSGTAKFAEEASGGAIRAEAWMRHFICQGMAAFEQMLGLDSGPYCGGEKPGLADICLVPQLYNAARWGVAPDAFPRAAQIGARLAAFPAFAAAHPDRWGG